MTDLDRLARLRPDVADPSPEWLAATRSALMAVAAGPSRRRGPGRTTLVAIAGIAVLAVIALVVPVSSHLLTAGHAPQFVYVKQGIRVGDARPLTVTEAWYRIDGGTPDIVYGDQSVCTQYGNPGDSTAVSGCPLLPPGTMPADNGVIMTEPALVTWSHQQLQTLPTNSARLRDRLYELAAQTIAGKQEYQSITDPTDYSDDVDQQAFLLAGGVLLKGLAPPDLVTALRSVLWTIPGVTTDQHAQDASGRAGLGFSRGPDQGGRFRMTLVFAADGHRFLGTNAAATLPRSSIPSVVLLGSGLVDGVGDRA